MSNVHKYPLTICEQHLDSFGHVNNAIYLQLLEAARWDLITGRGYSLELVHQTQQGPTTLAIELKFRKELTLRQNVIIETELISYRGKIGKLSQRIKNEARDLCTEAMLTISLFDMKKRKLIAPTEAWKKALGLTYKETT